MNKYTNAIVDKLNELTGGMLKHYIEYDDIDKKAGLLGIRIPGSTVGSIQLDKDDKITKIKLFSDNYSELAKLSINSTFVGKVYDFSNDQSIDLKKLIGVD